MMNLYSSSSARPIHPSSLSHVVIVSCLVATFSYLAARLGGALVSRPEMIWPFWPGCAFLVAVLLLTSRKIWPFLLIAGLAGFAVYDAQEHIPLRATGLLLLADSVEILVASLGAGYVLGGAPRLNGVKSLAKYSLFAVFLAPISVASIAASAFEGDSFWVSYFTEALALLTLTPAILGLLEITITRVKKPKTHYAEAVSMCVALIILSYLTFVGSGSESRPALLYSLVPVLLWAALRFGITGTASAMVVVAFLAIFGAVHRHGPFTGNTPTHDVLSLQLFLLVAGASFMVLAAVVEEHKAAEQAVRRSEEALRTSEERLRMAQQGARIGSFDWNLRTGVDSWTPELEAMHGLSPGTFGGTQAAWISLLHPDDRADVLHRTDEALRNGDPMTGEWRVIWPDKSVHWIAARWQVLMNGSDEPSRVVGVNMDITERKRAEEARLRHAAIVESSEDAIISNDLDATITSWNAGAEQIFGYREEEVVGRPIAILMPPELADEDTEILRKLSAGERIEHHETKRLTKAGTLIDVSLTIVPIKDSMSRVVGFTNIAHDITDRKNAEQAVKESEARFRLVADTAPVLIWMSGTDKLCTYFNKPWLEFTGRSLQQELGNGWAEAVHPDDFQKCLDTYIQSFERREKFRMEYRLRRHDGEYRWILDIGVPRFNQDRSFAGYIGSAIDVTEKKIAEEDLRELNRTLEGQRTLLQSREELLRIFVKNVPAGVAMVDSEMRYLQVSDRWCADYSLDSSQILGRSHYEVFPDIPNHWKEVYRRALEGQTLSADEDPWDRGGNTTWVRWEVRPWKTDSGTVGGVLIFAEDITRRKQMEEALSGISRKLIEAQDQERARIARELHDDIAQRLALLAIQLEQIRQNLPDSSSDAQTLLGTLSKRATQISTDVQSMSHELHSSKLEYLGIAVALRGFCREFGAQHRVEIDFKSEGLPTRLSPEISLCLFRIVQEALHNSVKHSGVRHFEVQLRGESREIHLNISDSGRGFQLEATMQGRGLGLISMRERARLVNGTMSIESTPMQGTMIHVSVPFNSEEAAQRAAG